MHPAVTLTDKPDPTQIRTLHNLLRSFNDTESGYIFDARPLLITLADPATGDVLGGLFGATGYAWLHVDMLFVSESLRGSGLGTQLMRQAEDEALRRGCRGAYLDTFDFQARGFYERLGYTVFGQLEDTPPGHTRFFLKKLFA